MRFFMSGDMQALAALENDLKALQEAAKAIAERNLRMRDLLMRMLDPEDLGWAVSQEVRREIRAVITQGRQ